MQILRISFNAFRGYRRPSDEEIAPLVGIAEYLMAHGFRFCRALTADGISEITHTGDAPYNVAYRDLEEFRNNFVKDFFDTQKKEAQSSGGWISSLNYGHVDVCLRKGTLLFRAVVGGGQYIEWCGYEEADTAFMEQVNEKMQQLLQPCQGMTQTVYEPRKFSARDWE